MTAGGLTGKGEADLGDAVAEPSVESGGEHGGDGPGGPRGLLPVGDRASEARDA